MKRFFLLPLVVFLSALILDANAQNPIAKQIKNSNEEQLYKVGHTGLKFGNSAYSQLVLRAWKDFDNNTLDNSAGILVEDVIATLADGTVIKGKANFMKMVKEYRNSFATASSSVDAVTTMKSVEYPEDDVTLIWGLESGTMKDGTTRKTRLHEIWVFNKEGKVKEFHQYAAKDAGQ